MIDFVDLGAEPSLEERIAEFEVFDVPTLRFRCRVYVAQLRRTLGNEPNGARLRVVRFRFRGPPTIHVLCDYDEDKPDSEQYARQCLASGPDYWDLIAWRELFEHADGTRLTAAYEKGEYIMCDWIDFKELRRKLDFAAVLKHYGVEIKAKHNGEQHQGFCPLPTHRGEGRSPSFSAHLKKGIWRCFGHCKASGDVLSFAARMQGLDPNQGGSIRRAALTLIEEFGIDLGNVPDPKPKSKPKAKEAKAQKEVSGEAQKNAEQAATCPAIVNAPVSFQLQGLDADHPYLKERGFTQETIRYFGLGYCSRGSMQGRIAIPIHNEIGQLVGYAGRLVDDGKIDAEHPKYLFPAPRVRDGKRYEFHKSLLLYHNFQVPGLVGRDLIVVEGFASVWHLFEHGFPNVVALMGSDCSEAQAKLILKKVDRDSRIWLMPDADEAGVACGHQLVERLAPFRFVRWAKLKDGMQPTDLSAQELSKILGF
jgi:DNA primase